MSQTEAIAAAIAGIERHKLYLLGMPSQWGEMERIIAVLRSATDWEEIGEKHRDGGWWQVWNGASTKARCLKDRDGATVWYAASFNYMHPQPTHAMPLPEGPKTQKEDRV